MSKKTPEQIIQNAIDIQEQCIPRGAKHGEDYMLGMLNGLKYGQYAITGGNIEYRKTNLVKRVRHKSIKRLR